MIKQGIVIVSLLGCVWLLSAWEFGAVGVWSPIFVAIIGLAAVCSIIYFEWKWADEERRRDWKDKRIARKMMEQTNKERYLRDVA